MFGIGRRDLGSNGERIAEQHLRNLGMRVLARNFTTPVGEVDLIMRDRQTVVFVEVKTRTDDRVADPEESVGPVKQRHMVRAAQCYLARRGWQEAVYRFDIVAVLRAGNGTWNVRHVPAAFVPGE